MYISCLIHVLLTYDSEFKNKKIKIIIKKITLRYQQSLRVLGGDVQPIAVVHKVMFKHKGLTYRER